MCLPSDKIFNFTKLNQFIITIYCIVTLWLGILLPIFLIFDQHKNVEFVIFSIFIMFVSIIIMCISFCYCQKLEENDFLEKIQD